MPAAAAPAAVPAEAGPASVAAAEVTEPAPELHQTPPGDPVPEAATAAAPPPPKEKKPLPPWVRKVRNVALAVFALTALGAGALTAMVLYYRRDLPEFTTLKDYNPLQTTKVLGTDGSVVGEIFVERRTVVPYGDIPPVMIQALTSAEDKNFFEHSGVDYWGIAKAFVHDLIPGTHKMGASTLTQQTVKTMLLSNERSIRRKIKEIILARRLEQHLTKEEILHIYLNQIYFGHKRYGIEEASEFYFGHSVKELTLGEAAILASIPKSPNEINPLTNPKRLKERQTYVLDRMVENGYISKAVAEREIAKPIPQPPKRLEFSGDYYVDEVKRQLYARFGQEEVDKGGLRVETAMDPRFQAAAETAMKQGLRDLDKRQGWRGPLGHLDDVAWEQIRTAADERITSGEEAGRASWGPVPILDLHRIDSKALEDDDSATMVKKAGRGAIWKRAAVNLEVVAHVKAVNKSSAEIDLGSTTATLQLQSVAWARKYNPTSMTAMPKSMTEVMKPGDLVKVRVTKVVPCDEGTQKKSTCKGPKVDVALEQDPLVEGALVSIDPQTRNVLALVGGFEFDARHNAFNRATQAKRQPGSAFKPFVYATALQIGQERALLSADPNHPPFKSNCVLFTPEAQVNDAPEYVPDHWTGKPWIPHNFERDSFDGFMTLTHALATSKNTVAVKLIEQIGCSLTDSLSFADEQAAGLSRVKLTAQRAGIDSPIPDSITAALGSGEVLPLELTNAYATLADQGKFGAPVFIKRVVGPGGEVLFENKLSFEQAPPLGSAPETPVPGHGLRADVSFVTANMMRSVVEDPEGTARGLQKLGRPIAGKTGTASEHRDAWFVGFTPELVTGVWTGFDDHAALGPRETGSHAAGPIWLNYMKAAEDLVDHRDFEAPPGVVAVDIDPRNGLLADPKSPYLQRQFYLSGTEPKELSQPDQVKPEDFLRGEIP